MIRVVLSILGTALAVIAFVVLSRDLAPPKSLTFAAGPEGGGYHRLAVRYRTILARDGIDVTVLTTAGSVENARLLDEGRADVGLLQGGVETEGELDTLGAVFLEPVFVFVRKDAELGGNLAEWPALTVAAGIEGSGTRAAVLRILDTALISSERITLLPVGGRDAADAILDGRAQVAIFVAPVSAPYLTRLTSSPDVDILRLEHLTALSRRLPDSHVTDLPSASFSFRPPNPRWDVPMLTLVANLVAEADLHPALVDRLVMAAIRIHGRRDILSDDGAFPTMAMTSLPQDPYARDLIAEGPSVLARFLPYWVVAQINRFVILLLPILFIVLPLLRALPGVYVWRQRRRVFRHYAAIRAIDQAAANAMEPAELDELSARLDRIEAHIARLKLPLPYREYAYTTRLHIDMIRRRIEERLAQV